jgi:hypothetical protein
MRRLYRLSVSAAAVMAVLSADLAAFASAAYAGKSHSAPSRSASTSKSNGQRAHAVRPQQRFIQRHHQRQLVHKQPFVKQPLIAQNAKVLPQGVPFVAKKFAASPMAQQILVRKSLPFLKPTNIAGPLKPRVALPVNLAPKLTLVKPPKMALAPKFAPFVQRHWKKAFFWVAVAGIGYLTIPEYYYDRWATYVDEDDYESAADLLALAALDDDDQVVRIQKPESVPYRYQASVAPSKVAATPGDTTEPGTTSTAEAQAGCTLQPFVDRQWSQPYSWVQVPEVGNVTVPDATYERFVSFVSSEPPNYRTACSVLAEAAAADTVAVAETTATSASSTN